MPVTADWVTDTATLLLAAAPLVAAIAGVIAAVNTHIARTTERRRSQPIVIAHETRGRHFGKDVGAWAASAYLRNEGGVAAFNVRFGVEYAGVRFPFRLLRDDPDEGNYHRVMQPGERLPEKADLSFPIIVSSTDIWATALKGPLDDRAVYWCRYENAFGETWETRNPADRSAKLSLHRVKDIHKVEEKERLERDRVRGEGRDWEDRVLAELQRQREAT